MSFGGVSLKWNGFETNMINNLKHAYRDEDYSDVSLVCEGTSIKSHKVVLSACSPLFKSVFNQNPHPFSVIILQDISLFHMKALLSFIYNGEVNIGQEHLSDLLKAAESLKIRGLTTVAEDIQISHEESCAKNHEAEEGNNKTPLIPEIIPKEEPLDMLYVETVLGEDLTNNTTTSIDGVSHPFFMQSAFGLNNQISNASTMPKNVGKRVGKIKKKKIKPKKRFPAKNISISTSDILSVSDYEVGKENMVTIEEDIEEHMDNLKQSDVETLSVETVCEDESKNDQPKIDTDYPVPKFPCPFCSRAYHTWGYRRRHVKSRHRVNRLTCKICLEQTNSQSSWFDHVVQSHAMGKSEAKDSLVVLVEAHAVLTCSSPPSPTQFINDFNIFETPA